MGRDAAGNELVSTTDASGSKITSKSITFSGSNTTVNVPLFSVTGSVEVKSLYGVVTTALGNHTAAYFRFNDGTAAVDITLATGTTLSSATAGSVVSRRSLVTVAAAFNNSSAARVSDPVNANTSSYFSPFVASQKTNSVSSNIEYTYTTTDTPTSGAIQFFCEWRPLSDNGNVTAV